MLRVRLYTAAFRLVEEETDAGSFTVSRVMSLPAGRLSRMANGIYYISAAAESPDGKKTRAPLQPVMFLR
jgi:hypothetical protein